MACITNQLIFMQTHGCKSWPGRRSHSLHHLRSFCDQLGFEPLACDRVRLMGHGFHAMRLHESELSLAAVLVPKHVHSFVARAVFFPAAWLCASVFTKSSSPAAQLPVLATALLQPAAILIDHGHFQYNNLGLGLSVSTRHCGLDAAPAWHQVAKQTLKRHLWAGSCSSIGGTEA